MKAVRTIISWLIRPHPSEKAEKVLFQEEARAERLANLIRLAYVFIWLCSTFPASKIHPFSANIANIGIGFLWILFSVAYHCYLLTRPYKPYLKYVSTTIDVLVTTGILFLYHFNMGYSTSLKAPPFMNYLLILGLAALRFNHTLPIYGGLLSLIAYSSLFIYFLLTQDIEFGSPLEVFTTPKINWVYQLYRIAYLATFTFLTFILVRNTHRLVTLMVRESQEALAAKAQQERTLGLFERYFSPEVSRYLLHNPLELGGRIQQVTVLVSDLRGFTSLSEKLGPIKSVSFLNNLFDNLVSIVFKYNGTVDKYLGDGMLVIFGIPKSRPDDPLRAVMAAYEMVEKVHQIGQSENADIGIAINTGEVIYGNIGSAKRMEFTVIGDTVNTAFRMEALNKEFGTKIIISDCTYQKICDLVKVRQLPTTNLRGKLELIKLYEFKGFIEKESINLN